LIFGVIPRSITVKCDRGGQKSTILALPPSARPNSCAAGVTVVNIDNGFGAGYPASVIHRYREVPAANG